MSIDNYSGHAIIQSFCSCNSYSDWLTFCGIIKIDKVDTLNKLMDLKCQKLS